MSDKVLSPTRPVNSPHPKIKRTRKTFACFLCREKKLRCDRVHPTCGRCRRIDNVCNYEWRSTDNAHFLSLDAGLRSRFLPGSHLSNLSHQLTWYGPQASVSCSEDLILPTSANNGPMLSTIDNGLISASSSISERSIMSHQNQGNSPNHLNQLRAISRTELQGHIPYQAVFFEPEHIESATLFRGSSAALSVISTTHIILQQFPDFQIFISDPAMRSRRLWQARDEEHKLRQRQQVAPRRSPELLYHLLPSNDEIEHLTHVYWDQMEVTFRVLHVPFFWLNLRILLDNRQNCRESFVAMVLLMMATVQGVIFQTSLLHAKPSAEWQNAVVTCHIWVDACVKWLSLHAHDLSMIETVQIRLLICIANQINSPGSNQIWEDLTSLLSYSISLGLHRDPGMLNQSFSIKNAEAGIAPYIRPAVTAFEQEMRRRLWSTLVEMELQASFDRGLPSFAASISANCEAPNNLADEEMVVNMPKLPNSVSDEIFTRSSYLRVSHRSLPLRVDLNKLINNTSASLSFKELLEYDNKVLHELQNLPDWAKCVQRPAIVNLPSMVAAVTLDIQIRQYLLPLHIPFAQKADSASTMRYSYSRLVCINTASIILNYHSKLSASGNSCLNLLRDDVFRASLSLCHHVLLWKAMKCDMFILHLEQTFVELLERAIELLEVKLLWSNQIPIQIWFLLAGYGMFRTLHDPKQIGLYFEIVVDKLTRMSYKALGREEQVTTFAPQLGRSVPSIPHTNNRINHEGLF